MWLRGLLVVAAMMSSAGISAAAADNMTGRYKTANTAEAVTDYLDLRHTGSVLDGDITGYDTGTLTGEAFADNSVQGTIDWSIGSTSTFNGAYSPDEGLRLKLRGPTQELDVIFAHVEQVAQVSGVSPAIDETTEYYYLDAEKQQRGPLKLHELRQLVQTLVLAPETLVWTAGMTQWEPASARPEVMAEPEPEPDPGPTSPPAAAVYYVLEGSAQIGPMTVDDVIARITAGTTKADTLVWKPGLAEWMRADSVPELAAAFGLPGPTPEPEPPVITAPMTDKTVTLPMPSMSMTAEEARKLYMVVGSMFGILIHEFGHALIGEINIPATGPEEDTADEAAAILVGILLKELAGEEQAGDREVWRQIARYATFMWKHMADTLEAQGLAVPWFDEHSEPSNRFRNMLCLIYGADASGFKEVADSVELPDRTRNRCLNDFPRRRNAWEVITAPYRRADPGDRPGYEGKLPKETPGKALTVVWTPSKTATGQALLPVLQSTGIVESIVDNYFELAFVWPRDFKVEFADCGEENAFYDPQNARIIMCWEGVEFFAGAVLDGEKIPRR